MTDTAAPRSLPHRLAAVSLGGSLQRKLIWQFLAAAAVAALTLFLAIRVTADRAAEAAQDAVLAAATLALSEGLLAEDDQLDMDLPATVLSMLSAMGEDHVFYRVVLRGQTVTGYEGLALPDTIPTGNEPLFYETTVNGTPVRAASLTRAILFDGAQTEVQVALAQTRHGQAAIADAIAWRAGFLGIGFFVLAVPMSLLAARAILGPVGEVADGVARRGPQDLRPVAESVPPELAPFIAALNGFILRLRLAHSRTETFIAEAAHHIRTPLSAIRAEAEVALHQAGDDKIRTRLRRVIRSAEECSRSASQLMDHALVMSRSEQEVRGPVELGTLLDGLVASMRPTAELRELSLHWQRPEHPVVVLGDRLLVETALRNILDNAIKYSNPDDAIDVLLDVSGRMARISVLDRGRGIARADLASLAPRFQRGENVRDIVGSGLGLTMVTEVSDSHDGVFRLDPREGGGTCAVLCLPLA